METVLVPQWFTAVMGTGILAVVLEPHAPAVALAAWVVAAVLLVVLGTVTLTQHEHHVDHPVQRHFLGAPAMALMTVGSGALVTLGVAGPVVLLSAVLWTAGTTLGVVTAIGVPWATRGADPADVVPGWLIAVVPPTVSATTGALLVPHVPAGTSRTAFVLVCWALLALSVVGTVRVLTLLVRRVRRHGPGPAAMAPAWLIVLGPLGQSVTAVHHLGRWSGTSRLTPYVGTPVLLAALVWLVVAAVHVARSRPARGPAWWSFTFPIATLATGSAALGWSGIADGLVVLLVVGWLAAVVATATVVRGVLTQDRHRRLLGAAA